MDFTASQDWIENVSFQCGNDTKLWLWWASRLSGKGRSSANLPGTFITSGQMQKMQIQYTHKSSNQKVISGQVDGITEEVKSTSKLC